MNEKFICVCGKEFESEKIVKSHQSNCNNCKINRNKFYSIYENQIKEDYKKLSLLQISEKYNVSYKEFGLYGGCYGFILNKFKRENYHIKTIHESNSLQSVKNKRKDYFIKNYGVENASQIDYVKEKIKSTRNLRCRQCISSRRS